MSSTSNLFMVQMLMYGSSLLHKTIFGGIWLCLVLSILIKQKYIHIEPRKGKFAYKLVKTKNVWMKILQKVQK